jgi:ERCC4-related helicase
MVDDERITFERAKSLSLDLDELGIFVSIRKELSENVSKSGLQQLENLKSTSTCLPQGLRTTVQSTKFMQLLSVVRRAQGGSGKAEKSQPRMIKLKEILEEHFQRRARVQASTKVIVFTALRSTVNDIVADLSDTPGVTAKAFIGQASSAASNGQGGIKGLTQLEQAAILKSFNAGSVNVLVATSVAEEGLDIDEVDLIVFFEAVKSPIRNMQRMGRTGRKRSGRIVILTVDGDMDKIESSHNSTSSVCKVLKDPLNHLRLYKEKKDNKKKCLNLPPSDDVKIILQKFDIEEFRLSQVGNKANSKTILKVCKGYDFFMDGVD